MNDNALTVGAYTAPPANDSTGPPPESQYSMMNSGQFSFFDVFQTEYTRSESDQMSERSAYSEIAGSSNCVSYQQSTQQQEYSSTQSTQSTTDNQRSSEMRDEQAASVSDYENQVNSQQAYESNAEKTVTDSSNQDQPQTRSEKSKSTDESQKSAEVSASQEKTSAEKGTDKAESTKEKSSSEGQGSTVVANSKTNQAFALAIQGEVANSETVGDKTKSEATDESGATKKQQVTVKANPDGKVQDEVETSKNGNLVSVAAEADKNGSKTAKASKNDPVVEQKVSKDTNQPVMDKQEVVSEKDTATKSIATANTKTADSSKAASKQANTGKEIVQQEATGKENVQNQKSVVESTEVKKQPQSKTFSETVTEAATANVEKSNVLSQTRGNFESARLAETRNLKPSIQIAQSARLMVKNGQTSMKVQLYPEDLGRIELQLVSGKSGMSVVMVPDQAATGKLLESQLDDLRQALNNAGIELTDVNVSQQGDKQQAENRNLPQGTRGFGVALAGGLNLNQEEDESGLTLQLASSLTSLDYRI